MTTRTPIETREREMLIGDDWVPARSGARYDAVDPYDGRAWASVPDAGSDDVDAAVGAARAAMDGPWGRMTGFERAALMRRLAEILARDADELAALETRGNGKLLRETSGQMAYIGQWYLYFSGLADKLEGSTIPADKSNFLIYTRREPVGVVGAILPWNSPLLLLTWKLAPALAAGCSFVVKPSPFTPVSTLAFAERMVEAGFPPGVFNVVTGASGATGAALAGHPGVDKITFTGSTATGVAVGKAAMENVTRVSLELGGKSAQVVFEDADLPAAAVGVVAGIFAATGQTCVAGSRLLVHESVKDELLARLTERASTINLGDPLSPETEMGPLANEPQLVKVQGLIDEARQDGATVTAGGAPPEELGGYFMAPTILSDVRPQMRIAQEEVFGPVLAVMTFSTDEEAVALANSTPYGLAAGVWTESIRRAHRIAARLDAGTVWINTYRSVAPNAPFGGVKQSGIGRESGVDSVLEYTETKTVWVETADASDRDPFRLG
jgi:aldehyde dehydrogenase (NAD+)